MRQKWRDFRVLMSSFFLIESRQSPVRNRPMLDASQFYWRTLEGLCNFEFSINQTLSPRFRFQDIYFCLNESQGSEFTAQAQKVREEQRLTYVCGKFLWKGQDENCIGVSGLPSGPSSSCLCMYRMSSTLSLNQIRFFDECVLMQSLVIDNDNW